MVCQMLINDMGGNASKQYGLEYSGEGADVEDTILHRKIIEDFIIIATT